MRFTCIKQDTFGGCGLARVYMGNDSDITIPLQWILASHQIFLEQTISCEAHWFTFIIEAF
jgi:hypothetical protein